MFLLLQNPLSNVKEYFFPIQKISFLFHILKHLNSFLLYLLHELLGEGFSYKYTVVCYSGSIYLPL